MLQHKNRQPLDHDASTSVDTIALLIVLVLAVALIGIAKLT